ncbi:MAG: hypothetical protein ACLFU6_03900, partial [Candidatus Hydrogenedentota bacterium]
MPMELPTLDAVSSILRYIREEQHYCFEAVGLWGSAKTLLAVQLAQALERPLLIVTRGRIEAEAVHEDLMSFAGAEQAMHLPAWEVLPTDVMAPSDDIVAERMHTLQRLSEGFQASESRYAAAPVRSLLQCVIRREQLESQTMRLGVGDEYDLEGLAEQLVGLGYSREVMVEQRGQLSVRGGIFDVFPVSAELPYRIEFFGDEIESIRRFEPETQRSIEHTESITILPRSEKALLTSQGQDPENLAVITDYLPADTLIVLDEPMALREEAEQLTEQFGDRPFFLSWDEVEE